LNFFEGKEATGVFDRDRKYTTALIGTPGVVMVHSGWKDIGRQDGDISRFEMSHWFPVYGGPFFYRLGYTSATVWKSLRPSEYNMVRIQYVLAEEIIMLPIKP